MPRGAHRTPATRPIPSNLPNDFPRGVRALACDLDRTLIAEDAELRPRTRRAIAAARARGIAVVIVTGRMFRAVRPYLDAAGIAEPVVCYQGALVADPASGEFLLHVPIPYALALEGIDAVVAAGYHLNVYVDDTLYVAEETREAHVYADFQGIEINVVGDLHRWLRADPTKLVVVGPPVELDVLRDELRARFGERMFVSKSLPHFLELANPAVSKGSGLEFVAERVGFRPEETIAFGDGENDLELLDWAGYGVAVENAHPELRTRANFVCPRPEEEGVAQVIEAYLDRSPSSP